jgi:hypothetical protein
MIILPNRHEPRTKILAPLHEHWWREPSRAQFKDDMGNQNCTMFRLTAVSKTGRVLWRGFYRDRNDFDAVLNAIMFGRIRYERALWCLSEPEWCPDIDADAFYQFHTMVFLSAYPDEVLEWVAPADFSLPRTAPAFVSETEYLFWSGSPTFFTATGAGSDTAPSDWNSANNKIEVLGAGGSGGRSQRVDNNDTGGGGGGAYSASTNLSITGGATCYYSIGSGGPRKTTNGAGTAGGDTWFNKSSNAAPSATSDGALAKGGAAGFYNTAPTSGSAGGAAASGVGTTKYSGGSSGFLNSAQTASGGGGAAGMNGAGNNSPNPSGANAASTGGSADAGFGGAAGSPAGGNNPGGNGTEWSSSYGSGGGGAGWCITGETNNQLAGSGGNYGGAGGASCQYNTSGGQSGAGIQGLLVVTYTPTLLLFPNAPMMGL